VCNQIEALQLDSEAVLKSIEAQHGLLVERARGITLPILTFHEYFLLEKLSPVLTPGIKDSFVPASELHGKSMARSFFC